MIPSSFITAWRKNAPWIENSQVEQDLIINCREHYTLFGYRDIKINVNNSWFTGDTNLNKKNKFSTRLKYDDIVTKI